jgi:hypothetical protein
MVFLAGGGLRRLDPPNTRPLDRRSLLYESSNNEDSHRGIVSKRLGSPYVPGSSPAPAVKREEEEDWGR